jgi:hypothetical protein
VTPGGGSVELVPVVAGYTYHTGDPHFVLHKVPLSEVDKVTVFTIARVAPRR